MTVVPPDFYDHYPTMPVKEQILDFRTVSTFCKQHGVPEFAGYYNGCTFIVKGTCYIWRIDDKQVQRHEYGHCNGWRHANPGNMTRDR